MVPAYTLPLLAPEITLTSLETKAALLLLYCFHCWAPHHKGKIKKIKPAKQVAMRMADRGVLVWSSSVLGFILGNDAVAVIALMI